MAIVNSILSGMEDQRVLGEKLRVLREGKGLTQQQLADMAGLSQPEIYKLESGKRRFTIDKVLKLSQSLSIEAGELLPPGVKLALPTTPSRGTRAAHPLLDSRTIVTGSRSLPIRGTAQGGEGRVHMLPDDARPVDWTGMPEILEHVEGAYGLFVFEESMHPMFKHGQTMWIHPHQPPAPGDGVIIVKNGDGEVIVKELVRRTQSTITVRQYNPAREFEIPAADCRLIHRVVGLLQAR